MTCTKPPLGASIEEKILHASCVLNSIIYHLQELAAAYERVGNEYAAKDVRKTHARMVKMRDILHTTDEKPPIIRSRNKDGDN